MTQDISQVLHGWDFDAHELNVRLIAGDDGKTKIQMRIDLGLLQFEMDGRPDGRRPHDHDSLLDFVEKKAREYGKGYTLSAEEVDDLFREGWQFYQRYLCLFHLGDFEKVIRDTDRNLRLFAFIRKHAVKKRDKWRFDQYRPFVLMMNTRARAMIAMPQGRKAALAEIAAGQARIREFLAEYAKPNEEPQCFELEFLDRWYEELNSANSDEPVLVDEPGAMERLKLHLQRAIDREDYEFASLLRDEIRRLETHHEPT